MWLWLEVNACQDVSHVVQGTDYHRVIPTRDINTKSRDKFWQQTEKDEVKRKDDDMKRQQEEISKADQERKEREVGWIPCQLGRGRLDSLSERERWVRLPVREGEVG